MFHRQRKPALSIQAKTLKNITRIISAAQFLAEDKRQALVKKIQDLIALEDSRYESLCAVLIEAVVNYCQSLPETANSYYSQPGGLVDFALNRTEAALSLFKDFMVQGKDESLSEEQKLWQYALFSAAMLQEIGKLFVDYKISLLDANGQLLKPWNPLLESLVATGSQYSYEFEKESDVDFRRRLNLLLARTLMPASGFSWIASNPQVLAIWLALLNEDLRSAGTLGALLIRANAIAIQRYISEFMVRSGHSKTGRYAGTFSGGVPETPAERELAMGVELIQWLTKALGEGKIMVNKAPLFMVPGGLLMSQEMFQLFVREHPEYKNWQAAQLQKGLLSLGLHTLAADGSAESRFEQPHNQQMHSGVVLSKFAVSLPDKVDVHNINTGKVESMSALELINKAQYPSQFTQQQNVIAVAPLQQLGVSGKWQTVEQEAPTAQPGVRRGV